MTALEVLTKKSIQDHTLVNDQNFRLVTCWQEMSISETETVIKKIIPYLTRRGYDLQSDLKFEEPTELDTEERKGFIDILVNCGRTTPLFLIEAKRDGIKITAKHKKQAIDYGKSQKCLFVAITNGKQFELLNTTTGKSLKLNGSAYNRIPNKNDLMKIVIPQLKKDPKTDSIFSSKYGQIPFSAGLPVSKLNHIFKKCHNSIRTIEKNEEYAFSDFSKILFLKLLEEKWDDEGNDPLYTYNFHELASISKERADQVRTAINSMINTIKDTTKFGEVLSEPIHLKKDATYQTIVKRLAGVSFIDSDLDAKGATFEYFVRATLKGKKLGQYFTPRPLVKLMLRLGHYNQILTNLMANQPFKVLDPACGTGGFLVYAMNSCIKQVEDKLAKKEIHLTLANNLTKKLQKETLYGIDAHEGIAASAKMNMVVAGDGHNNIRYADSLKEKQLIPKYKDQNGQVHDDGKAHLIVTNPPFGISEGESLSPKEIKDYEIKTTKGQSLFLQKMIASIHDDSYIITVIDDGVLNTSSDSEIRDLLLKECRIEFVLSLPYETFRPNKINVKSSVLVLKKRSTRDEDLQDDYPIGFIRMNSLGYESSGDEIRNFYLEKLMNEISSLNVSDLPETTVHEGYFWSGFKLNSLKVTNDESKRLDVKYWDTSTINKIKKICKMKNSKTIENINTIETKRGKSPPEGEYVSQSEGVALVVKAGSNIGKNGILITSGDYLEKEYFKENFDESTTLKDGDILLASTGDGTLGKCCVYRNYDEEGKVKPAIADGHVTIIRVDKKEVYSEFLCDYLRVGFGSGQINRYYTGSTGLIEIQPQEVNKIIVPPLPHLKEQKKISGDLREVEKRVFDVTKQAQNDLVNQKESFYNNSLFFK